MEMQVCEKNDEMHGTTKKNTRGRHMYVSYIEKIILCCFLIIYNNKSGKKWN